MRFDGDYDEQFNKATPAERYEKVLEWVEKRIVHEEVAA